MAISRIYQQLKNVYHFFQAHAWRLWYGRPDIGLHIYGITGTNGKTTTCYILAGILAAAHGQDNVGMLTTVAFRVGGQIETNETKLTTLPSKLVYSYLRKMKQAGVTHVVLEMTSHALDQNRAAGLQLDGAMLLNISAEHLNYHTSIDQLTKAKMKIRTYLKPRAPFVVKGDDEAIHRALTEQESQPDAPVVSFTSKEAAGVRTPLAGDVNKENALAASRLAEAVGIAQSAIDAGVAAVSHVPGRMEWIEGNGFRILIDYAVTPNALEQLYTYVKSQAQGRVLAILGAAGLRDRDKRKEMASVVARYVDVLVITREDPWTENEEQIFQDLEAGLGQSQRDMQWRRIVDRKQALRFLIEQARPGDIVVATGKGAETGMGIGKTIVPYNERQVIEEILASTR